MSHTVKKLAKLAGVSVRALHHYDELGLLEPAGRSAAGYRLYGERELLRLQQIMLYRELDVPLPQIKAILDEPGTDPVSALQAHRRALVEKGARLARLVETIDRTIGHLRGEIMLRDEELYEGFSREEIDEIKAEAEARWGELYRESDRAVRRLTREALAEIKARGEAIEREVAAAAAASTKKGVTLDSVEVPTKKGVTLDSVEVQALMARWVQHLKSFYEPTPEIVAGLGDLYVNDPRFRARYDRYGPGTAEFFRDALKTYAQSMPRT